MGAGEEEWYTLVCVKKEQKKKHSFVQIFLLLAIVANQNYLGSGKRMHSLFRVFSPKIPQFGEIVFLEVLSWFAKKGGRPNILVLMSETDSWAKTKVIKFWAGSSYPSIISTGIRHTEQYLLFKMIQNVCDMFIAFIVLVMPWPQKLHCPIVLFHVWPSQAIPSWFVFPLPIQPPWAVWAAVKLDCLQSHSQPGSPLIGLWWCLIIQPAITPLLPLKQACVSRLNSCLCIRLETKEFLIVVIF